MGFRHLDQMSGLLDSDESDLTQSWPLDFLLERPKWQPEYRLAASRRGADDLNGTFYVLWRPVSTRRP
jgi:hypothetical protein